MTAKLRNVHVRVNDAATGQPTPVRIRITDAEGRYYPPLGYLAQFATGPAEDVGGNLLLVDEEYAYIPGTCEVPLPAGQLLIEIDKGPEYVPQRLLMTLGVGQLSLRCTVERFADLRREGWYSGDMRAHHLTPHAALLEAAAEDLAVVNLLASQIAIPTPSAGCCSMISNLLAFSGQQPALEQPGHMVVVNTHNVHSLLGSLGLLNCHRVVHPLFVGEADLSDAWTLADWCDQCHRKNGLVVWTGPGAVAAYSGFRYGEALADLILGKIDAIEVSADLSLQEYAEKYWYPLLNAGFRVPLVGSSGKESNSQQLGAWRTYARLLPDREWSYSSWIEAVRLGRVFASRGPLLSFQVNHQDPGSLIDLPSLDQPVEIVAAACGSEPFDIMEVLFNGEVLQRQKPTDFPPSASLHLETRLPTPGWLALRCSTSANLTAHSSPVYVTVAGRSRTPAAAEVTKLQGDLDGFQQWMENNLEPENRALAERLREFVQPAQQILAERANSAGMA